jgi:signal transduction histidine kinase
MAAGTAHHLNTPLASMLLRVQMIRRESPNGISADLDRLEKSIAFCQQFVRRLLDFTRMPRAQRQPEDIASVLEGVVGFIQPALQARQAQLVAQVQPAAGRLVLCDRNLIETALLALLSNASDAVAAGGTVQVRCFAEPDNAVSIEISDDGCGIPAENLEHLFEPFFTTKPPGKGTGLGLPMARHIVLEHGGTLEIHSQAGRGTTARVRLPLAAAVAVGVA